MRVVEGEKRAKWKREVDLSDQRYKSDPADSDARYSHYMTIVHRIFGPFQTGVKSKNFRKYSQPSPLGIGE